MDWRCEGTCDIITHHIPTGSLWPWPCNTHAHCCPSLPPSPTSYRFKEAISAGRVSAVQKIEKCCVLAAVGQVWGLGGSGGQRYQGRGKRGLGTGAELTHSHA